MISDLCNDLCVDLIGEEDDLIPPAGFAFLIDRDDNYIIDSNGNYIIVKIQPPV